MLRLASSRLSRSLCMSRRMLSTTSTSTSTASTTATTTTTNISTEREPGVVGLPEDSGPRRTLSELYQKTLQQLEEMPEDAMYRVNVEKITKYRMDVVNATEDIEKIEETLNVGQIPEIIEQAQDELELIPYMKQWKPWEMNNSSGNNKPVVIEVIA